MSRIFLAIVLVAMAVAAGLIKLGALSVWVAVLSFALKAVAATFIVTFVCVVATLVWRRFKG